MRSSAFHTDPQVTAAILEEGDTSACHSSSTQSNVASERRLRRLGRQCLCLLTVIASARAEPFPFAFAAANPACRAVAEGFSSEFLLHVNATHISTFNAVNHCGIGVQGVMNIVRVPRALFTAVAGNRFAAHSQGKILCTSGGNSSSSTAAGTNWEKRYIWGVEEEKNSSDASSLPPPSNTYEDAELDKGTAFSSPVSHRSEGSTSQGLSTGSFTHSPITLGAAAVTAGATWADLRDPADHTYPFNSTRGMFSHESIADIDPEEAARHRHGCVQGYLDALDAATRHYHQQSDETEGGGNVVAAAATGHDSSCIGESAMEVRLVFCWMGKRDGCDCHARNMLELASWWLERPAICGKMPAADTFVHLPSAPPLFLHLYVCQQLSMLSYALTQLPALRGLSIIQSRWWVNGHKDSGSHHHHHYHSCNGNKTLDPFAGSQPRIADSDVAAAEECPEDCEGRHSSVMDIGTALVSAAAFTTGTDNCRQSNQTHFSALQQLCFLCLSSSPLTNEGLCLLAAHTPCLEELRIYENPARCFTDISCLGHLVPWLERLVLKSCWHLTDAGLAGLATCPSLREVTLLTCMAVESLEPLAHVATLERLRVAESPNLDPTSLMQVIQDRHSVAVRRKKWEMEALESIPIKDNVDDFEGAHDDNIVGTHSAYRMNSAPLALSRLTFIELSEWDKACAELCVLQYLSRIRTMDLHLTSTNDGTIRALAKCSELESLSLAECFNVVTIEPLACIPGLRNLLLRNTLITDDTLRAFCYAQPPSLEVLDISECDEVSRVECVAAVPRLKKLNAQKTAVKDDAAMELVKRLGVADAKALISGGALSSLEVIDVRDCTGVVHGTGIVIPSVLVTNVLMRCNP